MIFFFRKMKNKYAPKYEVVISGLAGRFPESDNITELEQHLLNKTDLITNDDRRYRQGK